MRTQSLHPRVKERYVENCSSRSDMALWMMMSRPSNWSITGPKNSVYDRSTTLKAAMTNALAWEEQGYEIVAIVRNETGMHKVVVFMKQLRRLIGMRRPRLQVFQNAFATSNGTFLDRPHSQ